MIDNLVDNSKSALISAIEIHNKPIFAYRYEVVSMLIINAWELLLKAYLLKNHQEIKVIRDDGTTKPFEECVESVRSSIGLEFFATAENIKKVYEYRCNCIHFYQEDIDVLLYSLSSKSVELYSEFIHTYFGVDLSEESNLILLPIGFKKPISPIIYLSNKSALETTSPPVTEFIKSIITSTNILIDNNLDDSILVGYKLSLTNENRISNADIKAAVTKDEGAAAINIATVLPENIQITDEDNAKKIRLEEETLYGKIYTDDYGTVSANCKNMFSDFLQNNKFREIIRNLKNNPQFHRKRYLDFAKQSGSGKDYYTKAIYDEIAKHYTKK